MEENYEISSIIVENMDAKATTFSDSLKKMVNAKATTDMVDRMQGLDMLLGIELDTVKDCMNAMLVVGALQGDAKKYELVTKMMHEAPEDTPKTVNNNLFLLPEQTELDSIANILKDDNGDSISYNDIAGV